MIIEMIITFLALISGEVMLNTEELNVQVVDSTIEHQIKQQQNGWIAYSLPAAPGTPSMCCWNQGQQAVCDLNKENNSFGSSSDNPKTDQVHYLVQLKNRQTQRVIPVGDHCKVKADGIELNWLAEVKGQQSVAWLKAVTHLNNDGDENSVLYALSLHTDPLAADALFDLAKENHEEYSQQAVFWLGHKKGDALPYFKKLLKALPAGDTRRAINMGLNHQYNQNNNSQAAQMLHDIAENDADSEQQKDAIFWLGQGHKDESKRLLQLLDKYQNNSNLSEQLVFSLSQLHNDINQQVLLNIIKGNYPKTVKKQAIFWITQSDDSEAQEQLMELL